MIFVILNLSGVRLFNSLNLAMTIISSGGFLPTTYLSSILLNDFQIIITSILMQELLLRANSKMEFQHVLTSELQLNLI